MPVGQFITATATRLNSAGQPGDTSEFSAALTVSNSLAGQVFHDLNADGRKNLGEAGLSGRTVYLDTNNNGQLNAGESVTTTNASGYYAFVGLAPATYTVRAVLPSGWKQSTPAAAYRVTLAAGQFANGLNFGNYQLGSIRGQAFHDLDANAFKAAAEPRLAGWTVYLDANNNGQLDKGEASCVTDSGGNYLFAGLRPGTYVVRKVLQAGWRQSAPASGSYTVALTSGGNVINQDFGTYQPGGIRGQQFHDYDANGVRDAGEPGLPDWTVYLDANNNGRLDAGERFTRTDVNGYYLFPDLRPGPYTVREVAQSGWRLTFPGTGFHSVVLTSGQQAGPLDFGTTSSDPRLFVTLSRNQVAENAGPGAVLVTVSRSGLPTTGALTVTLFSSDTSEARVPLTVIIPAGQASVTIALDVIDDSLQDGTQLVDISALASGYVSGQATLLVEDNELFTF